MRLVQPKPYLSLNASFLTRITLIPFRSCIDGMEVSYVEYIY